VSARGWMRAWDWALPLPSQGSPTRLPTRLGPTSELLPRRAPVRSAPWPALLLLGAPEPERGRLVRAGRAQVVA